MLLENGDRRPVVTMDVPSSSVARRIGMTITTPTGSNMPKGVLRALLIVTTWCRDNGFVVKIFRRPPAKK